MGIQTANRLVGMILTLFLLCFANIATAGTFGLFTYTDYGSHIAITGYPESATPAVIPSSINGKPVTRIEQNAFWNCAGLTGVTIPTSITSIDDYAFSLCGLSQVIIPVSVTNIGSSAFWGCSSLTSITVQSSNATYSSALGILYNKNKTSLIKCPEAKAGNVSIPPSVTSIGNRAFERCNDLTSVTIPGSVTSIGSYAFASCTRLTGMTIPTGVASIGVSAFEGCVGLAEIIVAPSNAAYSGVDGLLLNKSQTTLLQCPAGKTGDVAIPPGVTSIGVGAFSGCSGLTGVTIPSGVTSVASSTFAGCSSLVGVTIPSGVTSIADNAFSYCGSLATVTMPGSVTSIGSSAFRFCVALTSVTIPSGVTNIGISAFYECSGLTNVTIPYGVTVISNSAFSGCSSLTSVSIPESVTIIGNSAFSGCRNLTEVTIPSSVAHIESSAFYGCRNLTYLNIPASVTSIGSGALSYCTSMIAITVDASNANYSSGGGILLNKAETTLIQCPGGKAGDIIIPASITVIGNSAFSGCSALTNVMIPASVTGIGSSAFYGCRGLTSIAIPSSVTSIGSSAFNDCTGLTSLTIPDSITSIASYAFYGCSSLTNLVIPNSVTSIGYGAFSLCSGLTDLSIPASVTSIGSGAFFGCSSLVGIAVDPANPNYSSADGILYNKSLTGLIRCPVGKTGAVTISASVTMVSSDAFSGCGGLTQIVVDPSNSVYSSQNGVLFNKSQTVLIQYPAGKLGNFTVPGGVASISGAAFSGCGGITGVAIPAGVTSIGDYAFYGCNSLMEIVVDPSNAAYSSEDGVLFNKNQTVLIQYPGGRSGNVTILAGVMKLESGALNDNETVTSLCFLGDSPSEIWYSFPQAATVHYFMGAIGFSSPYWPAHSVVNMGPVTPIKPWLIDHGFPFDANLSSDSNSDGVNLLMAYALGLDPKQNLSGRMPQPVFGNGWMSLVFYAGSDGISYKAETSGNMQGWTSQGVTLSAPDANGYRTASVPVNETSRFMRLSFTH